MLLPICYLLALVLKNYCLAVPQGEHTCQGVIKHPVKVKVNVTEPVTYRTYTWCLRIPPRCSKYIVQMRERVKVQTEMHNRTITVCCRGFVEMETKCVPACPPLTDCPNMHCNRTNHCYCSPGYTGVFCREPCEKGFWGKDCKRPCDCPDDYTCHHLTGDCVLDEKPPTVRRTFTAVQAARTSPLFVTFQQNHTRSPQVQHTAPTTLSTPKPVILQTFHSPAKEKNIKKTDDFSFNSKSVPDSGIMSVSTVPSVIIQPPTMKPSRKHYSVEDKLEMPVTMLESVAKSTKPITFLQTSPIPEPTTPAYFTASTSPFKTTITLSTPQLTTQSNLFENQKTPGNTFHLKTVKGNLPISTIPIVKYSGTESNPNFFIPNPTAVRPISSSSEAVSYRPTWRSTSNHIKKIQHNYDEIQSTKAYAYFPLTTTVKTTPLKETTHTWSSPSSVFYNPTHKEQTTIHPVPNTKLFPTEEYIPELTVSTGNSFPTKDITENPTSQLYDSFGVPSVTNEPSSVEPINEDNTHTVTPTNHLSFHPPEVQNMTTYSEKTTTLNVVSPILLINKGTSLNDPLYFLKTRLSNPGNISVTKLSKPDEVYNNSIVSTKERKSKVLDLTTESNFGTEMSDKLRHFYGLTSTSIFPFDNPPVYVPSINTVQSVSTKTYKSLDVPSNFLPSIPEKKKYFNNSQKIPAIYPSIETSQSGQHNNSMNKSLGRQVHGDQDFLNLTFILNSITDFTSNIKNGAKNSELTATHDSPYRVPFDKPNKLKTSVEGLVTSSVSLKTSSPITNIIPLRTSLSNIPRNNSDHVSSEKSFLTYSVDLSDTSKTENSVDVFKKVIDPSIESVQRDSYVTAPEIIRNSEFQPDSFVTENLNNFSERLLETTPILVKVPNGDIKQLTSEYVNTSVVNGVSVREVSGKLLENDVHNEKSLYNLSEPLASRTNLSSVLPWTTSVLIVIGSTLSAGLIVVFIVFLVYRRKKLNEPIPMESCIMAYQTTTPASIYSVPRPSVAPDVFFCPTFTNIYAEQINRELRDLSCEKSSDEPVEHFYSEIPY